MFNIFGIINVKSVCTKRVRPALDVGLQVEVSRAYAWKSKPEEKNGENEGKNK